jgi:hypothetical protein
MEDEESVNTALHMRKGDTVDPVLRYEGFQKPTQGRRTTLKLRETLAYWREGLRKYRGKWGRDGGSGLH